MQTPVEFIAVKKFGGEHSASEIAAFTTGYMEGTVAEYHMSAWLMAARLKGLSESEIVALTECIVKSGIQRPKENFGRPVIDKHSTGGVGDKPTVVLLPLLATFGAVVPTLTGRGLGHTGGTVDKLESIPGLRQEYPWQEAQELLRKNGAAFLTQTSEVARLDKRLYALRDVTSTVDSMGLITASILGKKLSESLDALVLDVKYGSGAFMTDFASAKELASLLKKVANQAGVRTEALLTDMNEPLGEWAGNAVEIREALALLKNEKVEARFRAITISLAVAMCRAAFPDSKENWEKKIEEKLASGEALEKFFAIIKAQGVKGETLDKLDEILAPAPYKNIFVAPRSGFLTKIDVTGLGNLLITMGAGRRVLTDKVDPKPGLHVLVRRGEKLEKGQPILEIYTRDQREFEASELSKLFKISDDACEILPFIHQI